MARLFRERIASAAALKKSRIVVAIDPPPSVRDVKTFAEKMIEDLQEHVCAIKLNFHLILPLSGTELGEINRAAHSAGLQCIADIKLNDIENTNSIAIDHLMGMMGFDSVIANPFLGSNALQSLVKKARSSDGGVIALVYMSHPGAEEGYGLEVGGKHMYRVFMERASLADADGIVVGANNLQVIKEMQGRRLAVYSPGIGAQGGDAAAAAKAGADYMIVGRAIVESKNPASAALDIKKRISSAVRD